MIKYILHNSKDIEECKRPSAPPLKYLIPNIWLISFNAIKIKEDVKEIKYITVFAEIKFLKLKIKINKLNMTNVKIFEE